MTKPTSKNNTQTTYNSDNATLKLNIETTIEIGYEFVKILQDNAFNGIDGADIVNHIAKVLDISEWIKIPNADKDQLRLHVFPILLSGRAREWWDNEIKDTVTIERIGSIINTESSKDKCDKPYKKSPRKSCSDSFFKPYLDAQEGNEIYNFEESNQYFPQIPVPADVNFENPNELCKSEEFMIVRYSIGTDEEFITLSPGKYNA
ncbi:hypothetical protein Tco_1134990 [Tanacetum coccineum]